MSVEQVNDFIDYLDEYWGSVEAPYLYIYVKNSSTLPNVVKTYDGNTTGYSNCTYLLCEIDSSVIGENQFQYDISQIAEGTTYEMDGSVVRDMLWNVYFLFTGTLRFSSDTEFSHLWVGVRFGEFEGIHQDEILAPLSTAYWTSDKAGISGYYATRQILRAIPKIFMDGGGTYAEQPYNSLYGLQIGVGEGESNGEFVILKSELQCDCNEGEAVVTLGKYTALGEANEWEMETSIGAKGYDGVTVPMDNKDADGMLATNAVMVCPITFQENPNTATTSKVDFEISSTLS